MTTHSQRALILYRRRRFINHLLTYLLTLSKSYHKLAKCHLAMYTQYTYFILNAILVSYPDFK